MSAESSAKKTEKGGGTVNRELILRALTDPEFRVQLQSAPGKALGKKRISAKHRNEIRFVLAAVRAIEFQIGAIADELLCANGGPCGIA